jgi:hypothetical protein
MLNVYEFGEALIKTEDLDPVYVAIGKSGLKDIDLYRWLFDYWLFYHMGTASYLANEKSGDHWSLMMEAAKNETPAPTGGRWPRGTERRHFRGAQAIKAVQHFTEYNCLPEDLIKHMLVQYGPTTQQSIMDYVQRWPMFGPWIAFKAADMLEALQIIHFDAPDNIGLMYREPYNSLQLLEGDAPGKSAAEIYRDLLRHFEQFKAPPYYVRRCGPLEVETILCKHKSHRNGHYAVGKDIHELHEHMAGWPGTYAELVRNAIPMVV